MLTFMFGISGWMLAHPGASIPLAVVGRVVFVLFSPYRACRWCRRKKGGRPRCWRCKGSRLTRRFGAYHVHKVKLSLLQAWDEREWWR